MSTLGLESVLVGDVGHGVGLTVITGVRVRTLGDLGVGVLGVGALDGLVVSGLGGGDSVGGFIAAEKKNTSFIWQILIHRVGVRRNSDLILACEV